MIYYHMHSSFSLLDSTTDFKEYVDKAVEQGCPAIAFTEHGNIYQWVEKKLYCDQKGIKYIHGMEAYLTQGNQFGKIRDNYHIILLAKNYDGVQEINKLFSVSSNEEHKYYNNRITFEEFFHISDNVIITSACLGGPIHKIPIKADELKGKHEKLVDLLPALNTKKNKLILTDKSIEKVDKEIEKINSDIKILEDNIEYLRENYEKIIKKCDFLEIQPHIMSEDQKIYNQLLLQYSKKYKIPLIAGTDTHSIDYYAADCRKILKMDKDKESDDDFEDQFDLTWKTYDELCQMFKDQDALPEKVYIQALKNTDLLDEMVENFELDTTLKYPDIKGVSNEDEALQQRINERFKQKRDKGIIDVSQTKRYIDQLREEFRVFKKIGMTGFMLFMSNLMTWCRENNIPTSPCRGSCGGSLIAYITDIIDVDPIKHNTIFSRFANEDRKEIGDIDVDISPDQRDLVYDFIISSYPEKQTAFIFSYGTVQALGTIDSIGRVLGLDIPTRNEIKKEFKENDAKLKKEFPDLFEDVSDKLGFCSLKEQEFIRNLGKKKKFSPEYIEDVIRQHKMNTQALNKKYEDVIHYYDGLFGCPVSQSMHPAGIIVAPSQVDLPADYGVFESKGKKVLAIGMEECHEISLVKYDILGLKQVQINRLTCDWANIRNPLSHEIDWDDPIVWEHMLDSPIGVFQFEGKQKTCSR